MRSDARRNREAILNAARGLFAESADVAMCEVARRAGVGQATLYRNFTDRNQLASALLSERLEREEQLAAEHVGDPDAFFVLLRSLVETLACFQAIGELAREDQGLGSELERHRRRFAELLAGPLRDAKAAGTLRRDLTLDDVFLLVAMIRGALERLEGPAARAAAASRALTLALDGVMPANARA